MRSPMADFGTSILRLFAAAACSIFSALPSPRSPRRARRSRGESSQAHRGDPPPDVRVSCVYSQFSLISCSASLRYTCDTWSPSLMNVLSRNAHACRVAAAAPIPCLRFLCAPRLGGCGACGAGLCWSGVPRVRRAASVWVSAAPALRVRFRFGLPVASPGAGAAGASAAGVFPWFGLPDAVVLVLWRFISPPSIGASWRCLVPRRGPGGSCFSPLPV